MPSLHPSHRNRMAHYKLPYSINMAQRVAPHPWRDSGHSRHSTRPCPHSDSRNPGSSCQSTISNESQQPITHIQSSCQLTEQNRMGTSSQKTIQQTMDPDSGTPHPKRTRNRPRETVQRTVTQTYTTSSLDPSVATMARLQRGSARQRER